VSSAGGSSGVPATGTSTSTTGPTIQPSRGDASKVVAGPLMVFVLGALALF
jgi:hypothetical protein